MNLRTMAFAALATVAFGTSAVSFAQTAPGAPGTPPPPPVPGVTSSPLVSSSSEPTPLPSAPTLPPPTMPPAPAVSGSPATSAPQAAPEPGAGRGRHKKAAPSPEASPSETPEPPQFSTLDGVWEVALQPLTSRRAIYSHLYITQQGNTLTGTWKRGGKEPAMPFTGTFDGRLFKLTVSAPDSKTLTLSGYEENFMDMVGLFTGADPKVTGIPFTAGHRKSARERERDEKLDNTTPHPGAGVHPGGGIPPN